MALDKFLSSQMAPHKTWTGATLIQCDSEAVFTGNESSFRDICVKHGAVLQASAPYAHQQNGVAERLWRTLSTNAMAMLHAAGLDQSHWQFAFNTAAYIHNRMPSRANPGKASPWFLFTGKHPYIAKLRVYGCPAVVTLQPKPAKEDLPGRPGIFVGYDLDTPAYLVYDPSQKKLHKTMQLQFNESFVVSGRAKSHQSKLEKAKTALLDAAHNLRCNPESQCDKSPQAQNEQTKTTVQFGPGMHLQNQQKRRAEAVQSEPSKCPRPPILWCPAHLGHQLASWVKHQTQDTNGKCHHHRDTDPEAGRKSNESHGQASGN